MAVTRVLPSWAEDLRRRYLRGEAAVFLLHGNVFDLVVHEGKLLGLNDFLATVLLREAKETIVSYNLATGVKFARKSPSVELTDELLLGRTRDVVLPALEKLLVTATKTGVVIDYADTIAPAGEVSFQSDVDRAVGVILHRWSFLPEIEHGDNVVLLVAENLTDLTPKLVSNPRVGVVEIPMPDESARAELVRIVDPRLPDRDVARYAELTAGLKGIQLAAILAPSPTSEDDRLAREAFILGLLGDAPEARARAQKLAALTSGLAHEEIRKLLAPGAQGPDAVAPAADRARIEAEKLIARRKREILERECFGLVEFVEPAHGFEVVGGMDEVKRDLAAIASNIREGHTNRVPMGILFTGPMGTGKTFVAEAFARECGLTTIKLKNFRSKWVGATEGNLEKIFTVIEAIGQVVVIIDEGDRAFGNEEGESDGGTSARIIARLKEFMSDTSNRGRILFLVMTNRPDKLDVDLKRAGRLDRKIPFLYPQTPEDVENVLRAQVRKHAINTAVDFAAARADVSSKLVGYSNADIEAVVLLANDDAAREADSESATVTLAHFARAVTDYFPSRDVEMLEYMELLAVFEASNRRLLPAKYAAMSPDELDARLRLLRARVGGRR